MMFKTAIRQLHLILGLTAGLILSIMGITGAIYSYQETILKQINPSTYFVLAQKKEKLNPAEIVSIFKTNYPSIQINQVTLYQDAHASSVVNIQKEGARKGANIFINPYTAEFLPEPKGLEFFNFIKQLHRNLTVGETGKQITGISALSLLFFVISGIYLRWPKKHSLKQWITFKLSFTGRNFLWHLHAVVGTWLIVFYLLFAVTGLYWSYSWWQNGLFTLLQVDKPSSQKSKTLASKDYPINDALIQAWQKFKVEYPQPYSMVSFSIPKDQKIEIQYSTPDAKHEREKNTLSYNLFNQKFDRIELYNNKSLNQKIMGSMLPLHRGNFFGPIWQFFAMLASLSMPLFFITGLMLYIKRKKQKVSVIPKNTHQLQDWLIVYASQTGTAQQIAIHTQSVLKQLSIESDIQCISQSIDYHQYQYILFIASTYGLGDAPDSAQKFKVRENLSHIKFAVLALGSREYADTFCQYGHQLYDWLIYAKATPLFALIEVDNNYHKDLEKWYAQLGDLFHASILHHQDKVMLHRCSVQKRRCLNPNSSSPSIFHLELKPSKHIIWQAGDLVEIIPQNSPTSIQAFINKHQLSQKDALFLEDKDLKQPFNEIKDLETLRPRFYSIASLPEQGYIQLVVRHAFEGICSDWLCNHLAIDQTIELSIKTNPSFHLINDARPIIFIGAGTGISSLLALLQERKRKQFTQNWLLLGERHEKYDVLYHQEIKNLNILEEYDQVFSNESEYVQHRLLKKREKLITWLNRDAVIYVCGRLNGVGIGVEDTLIEILGESEVKRLKVKGRYKRDVY